MVESLREDGEVRLPSNPPLCFTKTNLDISSLSVNEQIADTYFGRVIFIFFTLNSFLCSNLFFCGLISFEGNFKLFCPMECKIRSSMAKQMARKMCKHLSFKSGDFIFKVSLRNESNIFTQCMFRPLKIGRNFVFGCVFVISFSFKSNERCEYSHIGLGDFCFQFPSEKKSFIYLSSFLELG